MTISLFKTLIAVSETGSFKGAADVVCVTHAAVGQQMSRLEDLLGVKLFDRSERTPRLNQLGKAFVPKAKSVVYAYETILDDLTGDPRMIGELILGALPSTIGGLIPKTTKRLVSIYPDLHIRIVPDLSPNLLRLVEQGAVDAAVVSEPLRIHDELIWMPFFEEQLVLLASPEINEEDPIKILATMPYIRHTRQSAVSMLAESWLSRNKVKVNDAMEMESLENLASMVAHNLGVSLGPNVCVPDPVFKQLKKITLGNDAPSRSLGILARSDCSKIRLIEGLLDEINRVVDATSKPEGS